MLGVPLVRKEDPALLYGARPLWRRSAGAARHPARPCDPLAPRPCEDPRHRRRRGAGAARRVRGDHRRGRAQAHRSLPDRAEAAGASMVARGRAGALCGRGGGAGGGREPVRRRRRRRARRGRLRAPRRRDRPARRLRQIGAAAASGVQDQRDLGPQIQLWRHRRRLRHAPMPGSRSRSIFPGSPSRRWNATSSSPSIARTTRATT